MTVDVRVGFMTVSLLEEVLKEYIKTHTVERKYVGMTDYLLKYEVVRNYLGEQK